MLRPPMRHVSSILGCALVSVALPSIAVAQTSTLSWTRSPGAEVCPTVVEVGREVEALSGRSVFAPLSEADRVIEASVAPSSEGADGSFTASIVMASREGEVLGRRELVSHDPACADLASMAALAIALMIDPDASFEAREEPSEPAVSEPVEPIVVIRDAPLGPPTRLTFDLGAAATLGVGPFVSGAGVLRVLLTLDGFVPFGIVGVLQPFSRAESAGGSVDFTTVLAGVTICPLFFHGPQLSAGGCAGVDLGGAIAVGRTLPVALRETERFLVQLDVSAYGRVALYGPLSFQVLAALFVPFRNDAWRTVSDAVFTQPEPVAGMLELGLSIDLTLAGDGSREQHLP